MILGCHAPNKYSHSVPSNFGMLAVDYAKPIHTMAMCRIL